ncbi:MAG TPA: IMP dehydrogenase, partial [Candidatus Omnitrophota bacterium]|nr:IMP dehydrogenase [Candidatus Omnitrophota bacterium]
MAEWIGIARRARRCYGFDEIALVPGSQTVNPNEVDTTFEFMGKKFKVPILAAAMDGVVDVTFAVEMSRLGGMAVLNLDGLQTRFADPDSVLEKIAKTPAQEATELIQSVYRAPIKEKLIARRVREIKQKKAYAAVSCIPAHAQSYGAIALKAGADVIVVQSTVTTPKHVATEYKTLDLAKFCKSMRIPVILGNCVTYETTLELMETGCAGLLIGVGPGAACTT